LSFSNHQNIQHQMFRIRFTELNEIFAVMSLRSFVCSMIGIFIAIYLYTIGFSLRDIFIFHIVMFTTELIFEMVAAKLISARGPKHVLAISLPFLIGHFWLLSTVQTFGWPLWFPAILGGIHLALYWQAYNYDFSKSKHTNEATKDVSRLYIGLAVLGAIAPLVGGYISTKYGFGTLYTVVILLLFFVFLPLAKTSEKHIPKSFSLRKIKIKPIIRDVVSYGGNGMEASASLVAWPLFVFMIVGTTEKVGLITSAALLITIVVTFVVGKRVNNTNRHKYIKTGSLMDGVIYACLVFVNTFTQVLSLDFARSLVSSLRSAPFVSEYYLHADEQNRAEYIYIMESAIDLFKIVQYVILFALSFWLAIKGLLVVGLLMGAVGSLLTAFMPRAKCELPFCQDNKIKLIPKLRSKYEAD